MSLPVNVILLSNLAVLVLLCLAITLTLAAKIRIRLTDVKELLCGRKGYRISVKVIKSFAVGTIRPLVVWCRHFTSQERSDYVALLSRERF